MRLQRARKQMSAAGVEALVLGPGPDMYYVCGYAGHVSERLTALVVGLEEGMELIVPQLEAEGAQRAAPELQLTVWNEQQDPVKLAVGQLRRLPARTVAVGDHLWSRFLLGLQGELPHMQWQPASRVLEAVR
ncbi:MAG: aminopeptidase P family N-terminal domain-containing protein, partial [Chloroflexota bacterium]|nr:aminopeptidase P family N-terminal domain-containing protein [Chloroflexota bacterium]